LPLFSATGSVLVEEKAATDTSEAKRIAPVQYELFIIVF
jgi:hypothetical protein